MGCSEPTPTVCPETNCADGGQGEESDEVAHQPAWLQEEGEGEHAASAAAQNGDVPSHNDSLDGHGRHPSIGSSDFMGLGTGALPAPQCTPRVCCCAGK